MKKTINIKEKDKAIQELEILKNKHYYNVDIHFTNVQLRRLNEIVKPVLFSKNDLFMNSSALWEVMQPIGESDSHNHHGLTSEDIIESLVCLTNPYAIFKTKQDRIAIITTTFTHFNQPLMIVIELNAALANNYSANINKIVTMYPKDDIDNYLSKINQKDIYYIKK